MRTAIALIFSTFLLMSPSIGFTHEGHKEEHNHPYPTKKFSVDKGKKIYDRYCASCHGETGNGQGPLASGLDPKPTNFLDLKYMTMRSRVDHYGAIANGRPETSMSPWKGALSEEDIWNVISYLEHLFNHRSKETSH